MFRLSGDFIYTLAGQLRPIEGLTNESTRIQVFLVLNTAIKGLDSLLTGNALGLRASWSKCHQLRGICQPLLDEILSDASRAGETIDSQVLSHLKTVFTTFEVTFKAELAVANIYVVTPKGAYDTNILAEYGLSAFPASLETKVREAVIDAQQAARCLAFDLPTAAAFHLHRAHEAVVHAYFRAIAPNEVPPNKQPLGVWITALEKVEAAQDVVAAIKDINRLHRNPVLHPDTSLTDSEEAIALLGSINTSMRYMLQKIGEEAQD